MVTGMRAKRREQHSSASYHRFARALQPSWPRHRLRWEITSQFPFVESFDFGVFIPTFMNTEIVFHVHCFRRSGSHSERAEHSSRASIHDDVQIVARGARFRHISAPTMKTDRRIWGAKVLQKPEAAPRRKVAPKVNCINNSIAGDSPAKTCKKQHAIDSMLWMTWDRIEQNER